MIQHPLLIGLSLCFIFSFCGQASAASSQRKQAVKSQNQAQAQAQAQALKSSIPRQDRIRPFFYFGAGFYSEKNQNQEIELRRPENYSFGLRYGPLAGLLESSQFEEVTGQGNFFVERKRKSYLAWLSYDVFSFDSWLFLPLGVGAGVYNETSIMKIGGVQDRVNGDYQWNAGLSAGIELRYWALVLKTEGQVLIANNQSPNPTWAAFAKLGILLF